MAALDDVESYVTVLPGLKQVLFIEVGFGADQHGQVHPFFRVTSSEREEVIACVSKTFRMSPRLL